MTAPLLTAGIDVGSSVVKVAVVEDAGTSQRLVAGEAERIRRRDPRSVAVDLFERVLAEQGIARKALAYVATTGDGEDLPVRTGHFYGMTTHARGALFLEPEARAALDIGALHARAVRMDARGKVLGYRMTSQCASGSGQFLENICRYLGIGVEEVGPLSLSADAPERCSSICSVLAETDVINMVSRGVSRANIIKGIHLSMAGGYAKLLASAGVEGLVLVTGGLASDAGLLAALREAAEEGTVRGRKLDVRIAAHPQSILAGAIGAAIWGAYRARKLARAGLSAAVTRHAGAGAPAGGG